MKVEANETDNCHVNVSSRITLNFNNLDNATQQKLISDSKKDVERKFGDDIKAYVESCSLDYDSVLHAEALRNLQNYDFVFTL